MTSAAAHLQFALDPERAPAFEDDVSLPLVLLQVPAKKIVGRDVNMLSIFEVRDG